MQPHNVEVTVHNAMPILKELEIPCDSVDHDSVEAAALVSSRAARALGLTRGAITGVRLHAAARHDAQRTGISGCASRSDKLVRNATRA